MNWNHSMNRGRLYIYMTNNHMYVHTKTGVGPCTCDTNINSRLHTCNAQHQPSVQPANIAYWQGEDNQPNTSRTES